MPKRRISKRHYKTRAPFVVVSVNPDGTVDSVFNSAEDAGKFYGVAKETVNRYCRTGRIGQGKKWFYEEDFREIYMSCELEKLQFTLPEDYAPKRKHFYKGHPWGNGWDKKSEKDKERYREISRMNAMTVNKSGRNRLGAYKKGFPVVCLTDGNEFTSIRQAARHYGIPECSVWCCVHRVGTTHKLKFRLKSQLANIKEVI